MARSSSFLPELQPLLAALGEELAARDAEALDLVVCGGAALKLLGVVQRPTIDVDVVAIWPQGQGPLALAKPFPPALLEARAAVARFFGLTEDWINPGPTDLLRWGLPEGCHTRFQSLAFGPALVVHLMHPQDLICLKLFAYADTRTARHREDLMAMQPQAEDWRRAVLWCQSQDDSEGFALLLQAALVKLGAPTDGQ